MCFGLKEVNKKRPSCCGIKGIEDARRVAHTLGIKHYVLNFDKVLQKNVIEDFIFEYLSGRTPNPCIRCNQYLKFEQLLGKAKNLGAEYLATGHYAKIAVSRQPSAVSRKYLLKKAKDKYKDQSYFLYRLTQKQLAHILFPLGNYTKSEVRKLASELNLSVKDKPGSQEICFIPDDDYREFLKRELTRMKGAPACSSRQGINANVKPGPILDLNGKIVGEHKGIPFYTIGQREGLGIARGYPIYIIKIDAKNNTIIVGKREEVFSSGLIAGKVSFTVKAIKREVALKVKIRYNHPEVLSKVSPMGKDTLKVIFSKPQFAVTPGQSVVFYKGNIVVGGGIIESGFKDAEVS
jgi:tRNA-specific 2-thiouridylase